MSDLTPDTIRRYAEYEMMTNSALNALIRYNADISQSPTGAVSAVINEITKDEVTTCQFVTWLLTRYALVYEQLCVASNISIEDALYGTSLKAAEWKDDPTKVNEYLNAEE